MKVLASPRRALLAAVAALLLLVPAVWTLTQPASAASAPPPFPLLYDPGPTNDCYSSLIEGAPNGDDSVPQGAPWTDESQCAADQHNDTMNIDSPHSAWDLGTYGWNKSSRDQPTGYSFDATSSGGGSKTITMRNTATGDCDLHETNVSYTYTDDDLVPGPDYQPLTMAEGAPSVSYRASIHQNGTFTCGQKRAILTTDFIFQDPHNGSGKPDVISVVHFDPGPFATAKSNGVQWDNAYDDLSQGECGTGCRVTVRSAAQIPDSSTTSVSDDFGQLFQTYKSYVDPWNLPDSDFILRGVQIVSSNEGSDTTSSVSDVNATFTPNADTSTAPEGFLRYGTQGSGGVNLCLDDFGSATQAPATADLWNCAQGDDAQNWTFGLDNTLQVKGLCLAANGASAGAAVALASCDGSTGQKWVVGRWNEIYNPVSSLCLADKGGQTTEGYSSLDLETCSGQPNEHWYTTD
ncbi:RICIN domain-containing protein [Streptantibioticus parmotrematis]|uniref:RICIN domain-containing protein n=1 Tax=Streptantibioticus parmotrematis TaxID=2873249 RepID=UPI0033F5FEC3